MLKLGHIETYGNKAETVPLNVACEEGQRPVPQPILSPLTSAAIFLVACIKPDQESYEAVRLFFADFAGLFGAVIPAIVKHDSRL